MPDFFDRFADASGMTLRPAQVARQRQELAEYGHFPKHAMFWSPRVGKSLAALATMLEKWGRDRTLVTCPLVAGPLWLDHYAAVGIDAVPLYNMTIAKGNAKLHELRKSKKPAVVIVNDDKLSLLIDELLAWGVQSLTGDESHRFAGVSANRARCYRRLASRADVVRILTGTPVPNSYGGLWGQMTGLSDVWETSYETFAQQYLIRDAMTGTVIGYQNEDRLYELIRNWASIARREDVFGPDTWQDVPRYVQLPTKAARIYRKLAREWILDEPDIHLNAAHTLARMTRLHQLTSGFLPDELTGEVVEFQRVKRDAILADLESIIAASEKCVIFYRFKREGDGIYDDITSRWPSLPVGRIDGSTPISKRDDVYNAVERYTKGSVVAVVQTQSGGIARSFAEAQHVMFASRGFSFVEEEQARDRVYKPGCSRVVYDYIVEGSIDEYIAAILNTKQTIHNALRHADKETIVFGPRLRRPRHKVNV